MNRRGFLKALGFGSISAALGSLLPAPIVRALRPIAGWARALAPGDLLRINVEAATTQSLLVTLGFRRDNGQKSYVSAEMDMNGIPSCEHRVIMPFDAMIESAQVIVSEASSVPTVVRLGVGDDFRPLLVDEIVVARLVEGWLLEEIP